MGLFSICASAPASPSHLDELTHPAPSPPHCLTAAPPASQEHSYPDHTGESDCTNGYGEWHYHGSPSAPQGEIYVGPWKNGKRDTTGRNGATGRQQFVMEDDEDHSYYEGGWEADKRHGPGTFVDRRGVFEGQYVQGLAQGEGEYTRSSDQHTCKATWQDDHADMDVCQWVAPEKTEL